MLALESLPNFLVFIGAGVWVMLYGWCWVVGVLGIDAMIRIFFKLFPKLYFILMKLPSRSLVSKFDCLRSLIRRFF